MDTLKLKNEDIVKLDKAGLRDTEYQVRKQLADIRMDIYTPSSASLAKKRKLKRNLARVLTAKTARAKTAK